MPSLDDQWSTRDHPVLVWIVDQLTNHRHDAEVTPESISESLDISRDDAVAAVDNLERGRYITRVTRTFGDNFDVGDITERALRTVGIWPSGEGVDALIDALRQAEDTVTDPDERTLIHRAAGAVGSVSRDVMVDVLGAVIARQSGAA